jgi:hypothetical protein
MPCQWNFVATTLASLSLKNPRSPSELARSAGVYPPGYLAAFYANERRKEKGPKTYSETKNLQKANPHPELSFWLLDLLHVSSKRLQLPSCHKLRHSATVSAFNKSVRKSSGAGTPLTNSRTMLWLHVE